ncbi:hypothetical protein E2562_035205 [Oryza meyeriana var. granulata]|uniref:Uncharacterized protein n=1 Tax=Oryza meyeriana var. granulata TaxID=110450 RepID=A0A6G1DA80_9ORYZ|nr:hypothetical protein E2562_035205 [Oryza meyeriana var. granulata]
MVLYSLQQICSALAPTPALSDVVSSSISAYILLQFAKADEIKLGGSHLAQMLLARDTMPDWRDTLIKS